MKNHIKRIMAIILSLAMIITTICIMPIVGDAASATQALEGDTLQIWADCDKTITQEDVDAYINGTSKTSMVGAVAVHRRTTGTSNGYYLFLPSTADCTNLRFWFNGKSLSVGNDTIENGGTVSALAGINDGEKSLSYNFKVDNNTYSITCMKSGKVGTVYIDTDSGSMKKINSSSDHTDYEGGTIMVVAPDGTIEYDGVMEKMQGRGNATWSANSLKNPYNVKLATSTSLLGMNKAKKWVLLANKLDPTLLRNQIGYDYSKYIGVKYQPTCKPVDVYCNQIYMGSYQLSEKVEIKSSRIDVNDAYENLEIANGTIDPATKIVTPADFDTNTPATDLYKDSGSKETSTQKATKCATIGNRKYSTELTDPDDITGGYLYELEISERWINEGAGFCGYNRQGWVVKSADYATKNMVDYSYDLLYALGSSVYNGGTVPSTATTPSAPTSISNPAPAQQYQGKHWSDLLDAESAVKYFWIQEYFKNLDSSTSSTYFYKDSDRIDSKLYAGPVWDLDHAMETVVTDSGLSLAIRLLGGRYGYNWSESKNWYARNVRIYMWNGSNGNETAKTDSQAPRSFYGALYYNNSDFQQMFNKFWYTTMVPANKILMGEDTDPTGTLKSIDDYFEGVRYSAYMNNIRHGYEINPTTTKEYFNLSSLKSGLKTWFTDRNKFINGDIKQVAITNASVSSIPVQSCNGSPVTPKLTLTYNNVDLEEGKDYSVKYTNNVNAGNNASAVITGLGYFTGTKTVPFIIKSGELASAEIYESAYKGDTITANVKSAAGDDINNNVTYQWYVNGAAIDGATEGSYTIADDDAGKTITLSVTGDGVNITGTVTSNGCEVADMERPHGFSKSIAAWDYDYSTDAEALTNADKTGATYYYTATSGEHAVDAKLTASVNAVSTNKIKWSGTADMYVNDSVLYSPDQSPVMGTSKSDGLAWGQYPYFETSVSTLGFQTLTFSAKLGGTKKGPRDWKLQYSLDGINYEDVDADIYTITANKNMELAFDNVALPDACNNKSNVYIRIVACSNNAINGINTIVGQTSGDASINNVSIKGESIKVITDLAAPTVKSNSVAGDGTSVFTGDRVEIKDNNGGASLFYQIDGGEALPYEQGIKAFTSASKIGDTVTITAWAEAGTIKSPDTVVDITFAGVNVNTFSYIDYSKNVYNGAVYSTSGAYDENGKMTAYTDGSSQYVPVWNDGNGAFCVSPDDGALWSANSGFYFDVATAGYENLHFSAKMYTTGQGPNSVSLQYSTDGKDWKDLNNTVVLGANAELEQAFFNVQLPDECSDCTRTYIRVVSVENRTNLGDKLHNNVSKGNLYINDVVISGEDNGEYKMPFTNKTSSYFGTSPIKYKTASKMAMQYAVVNPDGELILAGAYPTEVKDAEGNIIREEGIDITNAPAFYAKDNGAYTVSIWTGDDDDRSIVNTSKYYYKGDTVVKFDYTATKRPIVNYINSDYTELSQTNVDGNAGTLSMMPNGVDKATFEYTDVYGVKVAWSDANRFVATKKLDKPNGNGYWLIKASTKGYTDLTLTLEQLSSNKGPRDWGLAYSLDGTTYKYLAGSNVRAISNDSSAVPVETYNNFKLPAELDDKDNVFIKVFINGGESVDGAELETLLKGNTGMNGIEICGIPVPGTVDYTFNAVAYIEPDVAGDTLVPAYITINGDMYNAVDGTVTVTLNEGDTYTASACANGAGIMANEVTGTVKSAKTVTIPVVAHEVIADGVVNAKDYAMITKDNRFSSTRDYLRSTFDSFINYMK